MSPLCESWATEADLCHPCEGDYAIDTGLMEDKLLQASEVLFMLSGQQFPGECSETVRPCASGRTIAYGSTPFTPISSTFLYAPFCGCRESDTCGCPALSQVRLPRDNVTAIEELKIDGDVIPSDEYRLDPKNILLSTTSTRLPCCQNMRLDDDQVGTWSVTYTYGTPVPSLGVTAAATLACELYMACNPEAFEGICRLPYNVTSIARQGVSISKFVGELFTPRNGKPVRLGIPEIDMFLAAYNPFGNIAPSVILSPDDPESFRFVSNP